MSGWQNLYCIRAMSQVCVAEISNAFRCMSSVRLAELCSASGVCLVSGWMNSFLRQGDVQFRGRTLSYVRGMFSGLVSELFPALRACPVAGMWNFVLRKGMSSGWMVELCPISGACPVAWFENSFSVRGISICRMVKHCPASRSCLVAGWQNSLLRQEYVQWPCCRTLFRFRGMSKKRVVELFSASRGCPVFG
ncbi:hypothetical protein TNIN_366631 [Trichonephila inaurata madagascariensis]|uniref:Uncharacterized protein n=1 Tax=Trichonephila inaurata madagascariensis TaxID=2747483 RepID=A0A8X6MGV9_9ARAC|nr:hypothetical protein TNIN_366631 [Trichonephila inaurata madagascariensis]